MGWAERYRGLRLAGFGLALGGAEAVGFGGGGVAVAAVGVGAGVGRHAREVVDAAVHLGFDRVAGRALAGERFELKACVGVVAPFKASGESSGLTGEPAVPV